MNPVFHTANPAPPFKTSTLIALTGLLFSVGPLTVDMSLPGLTAVQEAIGNPASRTELTLTAVFLGMALGQFCFGAVADRYGRRHPLVISMAIYALASLAAVFAHNILEFGLARLVQALAYGVAMVLARSIVVDACTERTSAKVFSIAVTVTSLATVVAPALGGQLLAHFDWRAPMFAMSTLGILIVGFVWWIVPETLPASRRTTVGVSRILSTYGSLLRNRRFVAYAVVGASAAATQFSYNTGAPGVLIEHYGMSARTCGLSLSAIGFSMAVTSQINALLLRWFVPKRILQVAVVVAALSSALVLAATFTGIGAAGGLIAVLLLQISMVGFIMANSMAGAMSSAGMQAGAASALLGVLMFALGTIGSALIGILHDSSGRLMGCVIATFSVVSLLISFRAGMEGGASAGVGEDARPA